MLCKLSIERKYPSCASHWEHFDNCLTTIEYAIKMAEQFKTQYGGEFRIVKTGKEVLKVI